MKRCPKCKSDDVNFYADYSGRTARDHYCRCDNCGLSGDKSTTAEMAMHAWDKMKYQPPEFRQLMKAGE